MKTLYLLRHAATAAETAVTGDKDRPLTEQGFRDARLVSGIMRAQQLVPDFMISSTAKRAFTTAFVFAAAFEQPSVSVMLEERLYNTPENKYMEVIAGIPDAYASCMLTGHNNTISQVASRLMQTGIDPLSTCGMLALESPAGKWADLDAQPWGIKIYLSPELLR